MSHGIVITQSYPVPIKRIATADIIGFGQDGVVLSYSGYWRVENHVRLVGDTTGNGLSDIIGFGDEGVYISVNNGDNTFGPQNLVLKEFGSVPRGWSNTKHIRYVADLAKRGMVDIIGFGDGGIEVAFNNEFGNFLNPVSVSSEFGYNAGWRLDRHLRFLADTTGNGLPDVVAFGDSGVVVALNNGNGTFQGGKAAVSNFGYDQVGGGWKIDQHVRTLADITGNGQADIIGFGILGVWVSLSNGDGTFQPAKLVVEGFGYKQKWRVEQHLRFVADIDRDGCGDIVGFGKEGVFVARNNGHGTFSAPSLVLREFGTDQCRYVKDHPRFLADLTGDGAVDIVGFGDDATYVSFNDGSGNFGPPQELTDTFALSKGWDVDKTVRWVTNLFHS